MERYEDNRRELDTTFSPIVFKKGEGNIEADILRRGERFFARVKKEIGLNHLALTAADEAHEWHEDLDIIPLGQPGEKPMRVIRELRYYDSLIVAAVIMEYREDGSVAVACTRHLPSTQQGDGAYGEIAMIDKIITQEAF